MRRFLGIKNWNRLNNTRDNEFFDWSCDWSHGSCDSKCIFGEWLMWLVASSDCLLPSSDLIAKVSPEVMNQVPLDFVFRLWPRTKVICPRLKRMPAVKVADPPMLLALDWLSCCEAWLVRNVFRQRKKPSLNDSWGRPLGRFWTAQWQARGIHGDEQWWLCGRRKNGLRWFSSGRLNAWCRRKPVWHYPSGCQRRKWSESKKRKSKSS